MEEFKNNLDDEEDDDEENEEDQQHEDDRDDPRLKNKDSEPASDTKFWQDIAEALFSGGKDKSATKNKDLSDEESGINDQDPSEEPDILTPDEESGINDQDPSEEPDILTPDEETEVNQNIANEHLNNPVTEGQPEEPVVEFLQDVSGGSPPNEAFEEVIEQNELNDVLSEGINSTGVNTNSGDRENVPQSANRDNNPSTNHNSLATGLAAAGAAYLFDNAINHKQHDNVKDNKHHKIGSARTINSHNIASTSPFKRHVGNTLQRKLAGDVLVAGTILSAGITLGVIEKRRQDKNRHATTKLNVDQLNKKIADLQHDLTVKELTIQDLAIEKQATLHQESTIQDLAVAKKDKLYQESTLQDLAIEKQATLHQESTIQDLAVEKKDKFQPDNPPYNALKPAVESIGSVVVGAIEKSHDQLPSPSEQRMMLKHLYKPEQIANLNRFDLVEISSKIKIEGASLKNIYENGLISEKGLRRLVRNYLRDKDIRRQLRKEILENAVDFELDPVIRRKTNATVSDSAHRTADESKSKQLAETKLSIGKSAIQTANKKTPLKDEVTESAPHYVLIIVAVTLAVGLIGLLIYILYNR